MKKRPAISSWLLELDDMYMKLIISFSLAFCMFETSKTKIKKNIKQIFERDMMNLWHDNSLIDHMPIIPIFFFPKF